MKNKTIWLSQTMLSNSMKCHDFSWRKGKKSLPLEKGSCIHDMLENMKPTGRFTYSKVGSAYYDKITAYTHKHDFLEYEAIVERFYDEKPHYFESGEAEVVLEQAFSSIYSLRGSIDRVIRNGKKAKFIDWKTGNNANFIVDLTNKVTIVQAVVYAFMGFTKYPEIDEIEFIWEYIEMGVVKHLTFLRDQVDALKTMIFGYIMVYELGGRKLGTQCYNCQLRDTCPLANDAKIKDIKDLDLDETLERLKEVKTRAGILDKQKKTLSKKIGNHKDGAKFFSNVKYVYLVMSGNTPAALKDMLLGDKIKVSKAKVVEYESLFGELEKTTVTTTRLKNIK